MTHLFLGLLCAMESDVGDQSIGIYFYSDGAAERFDADNDSAGVFDADDDAAKVGEGSVVDHDALPDADVGPRKDRLAGGNQLADGGHFGIFDGDGIAGGADNGLNPRRVEDTDEIGSTASAENVTGEEYGLHFLFAVGPATADAVEREIGFPTPVRQAEGRCPFMIGANFEGKPGKIHEARKSGQSSL